MNKILVWDLPLRVVHWSFAGSLTASLAIGFLADDKSPLFQLHMLFGVLAAFLVVLRLGLGITGSRYARFTSYPLRPVEIAGYLLAAVLAKTRRYAGNNPGSALIAVLMFGLVAGLLLTGIGIGVGEADELHESLAWALLAVTGAHLLGIAWHTVRHRENIGSAMFTGRKAGEPADAIPGPNNILGSVLLLAGTAWAMALFAAHDAAAATVRLPLLGLQVRLGERQTADREHREEHSAKRHHHREHDDDD